MVDYRHGEFVARRVIVESPWRGDVARNRRYAIAAIKDCLRRYEAPFASHVLYTEALDDSVPLQRELGMECGEFWGSVAHMVAVYIDLGISEGMQRGIDLARRRNQTIEFRTIPGWHDE